MNALSQVIETVNDSIARVNGVINDFVWGLPALLLIGCVGIFYTIRLKGIQFTKFGTLLRNTIGKPDDGKKGDPNSKKLSSFEAAMTSVSAVVGSGNIAGVATALVCGGPGALFWMLIAALIGMATKYAEIILGMLYRKKNPDGSYEGGAMYYLADGLHQKWLGKLFALFVIPFAFVISAVVDTNTIADTLNMQFKIPPIATGIVLAVICAVIIFGGIRRIGHVCKWLAPIMGGMYILAGLMIIVLNIKLLPATLVTIVRGAFQPAAVTGGAVGSVFMAMRYGVARGMYSNEAGVGTAAMIHSNAEVDHPVQQGMWGPVEVFLDTIVICPITAIPIVMSGLLQTSDYDGAALTMKAFEQMLPGSIGTWICLGATILFGFSCLISFYTYAQRAATYLFGAKSAVVIKCLWIVFILIGSVSTLGLAWDLADTFNGLMIFPNLIGMIFLSREVIKSHNEYWGTLRS